MNSENQNSLVRYEDMTRADWRKFRPAAAGHTAAVSTDHAGQLVLVTRRPSVAEAFFSAPVGVHRVDVSVHHDSFAIPLPTADGKVEFPAEIDLSWRVTDPVRAVRDRVADGRSVYRPFVTNTLRRMSRTFAPRGYADAEQQMNEYFADGAIDMPCGLALLTCLVKLAPTSHDLNMHRAGEKHELDGLGQRQTLSLEQERMKFYTEALQTDNLSLIALRLSSNREDIDDVVQMVMQQRQVNYETAHGMLTALMDQRLINRSAIQDITARATKVVADHLSPGRVAAVGAALEPPAELPPAKPKVTYAELIDDDEDDDA